MRSDLNPNRPALNKFEWTEARRALFALMWMRGDTAPKIAQAIGCTEWQAAKYRARTDLPPRKGAMHPSARRAAILTPQIQKLRAQGMSQADIATALNISKTMVSNRCGCTARSTFSQVGVPDIGTPAWQRRQAGPEPLMPFHPIAMGVLIEARSIAL